MTCAGAPEPGRLAAQLRQAGFGEAEIAAQVANAPSGVPILEEAWAAFCLFVRAPWRRSLWDGTPVGLDWPQAESLARALAVPWNAETLDDLTALEAGALEAVRDRRR